MLVAEGANTAMGFALPSVLPLALCCAYIRADAIILGQGTEFPLSTMVKFMQQRLISSGIATQAEVDSISDQMHIEESRDPTSVYVWL